MTGAAGDPFAYLSPRETEVARHVRAALPNKQIAGLLGVSHDTIRTHLENIARKWRLDPGLERRAAIVNVVRDWEHGMPLHETGMVRRSSDPYPSQALSDRSPTRRAIRVPPSRLEKRHA